MGRGSARLAGAAVRIRARHIEIAKRAIIERMGARDIREHLLGHQFRPAVGARGDGLIGLGDPALARDAIDRRG